METGFCPERLKNIREERGINKAEAARLLGLSKMGYLRYETAARTPSRQMIFFMAQKLGTSPEYLPEYLTGASEDPEPAEYLVSRSDDPELFDLIKDIRDGKRSRPISLACSRICFGVSVPSENVECMCRSIFSGQNPLSVFSLLILSPSRMILLSP